jgi:DNA-binding MarR family transcriptional regulator
MRIENYLRESPAFAVTTTASALLLHLNRELKRESLHYWEALLLLGIFFEAPKPVRPSELAVAFRASRPQVSHCLSSLEKRKWIERRIAPGDARGYSLSVSREGKTKAARLVKVFDGLQRRFEGQWSAARRHQLIDQLRELEQLAAPHAV